MAVIPRYISGTPSTPSVNNVKMNPGTASAPYEAAAQTTARLTDVFQSEMGKWGQVLQAKEQQRAEAERKQAKISEGLYKAEAMADLSIKANALYQQKLNSSNGLTNFAPEFDAEFQKLADTAIAQAPSPEAQVEMTKRMISMRADYYNRATNQSLALNNQVNMNRIDSLLSQYEGLAAGNPALASEVKGKTGDIVEAMSALGVPEHARQKILDKFSRRIDYHAARDAIEKDPLTQLSKIQAGEYSHLGEGNVQALANYAKSTEGAVRSQTQTTLKKLQEKLMSGMPVEASYAEVLKQAERYGMSEQANSIERLISLGQQTSTATASELEVAADQIKVAASTGELKADPKNVELLTKFLEGNAKAIKTDALSYAELRGGFAPLAIIQDLATVDAAAIEERRFKALQVSNAYGVEANPLKSSEVSLAVEHLLNADPRRAGVIVNNLTKLGGSAVDAVAEQLKKKDPGLSVALRAGITSPDALQKVVQGRSLLANGTKIDKDVKESVATAMGNLFLNDPESRKAYIDAATAAMAYDKARGRSGDPEQALAEIGSVIHVDRPGILSFGKYPTIAPAAGMSSSDFEEFLDSNLKDTSLWTKFGTGAPIATDTNEAIAWNRLKPSDFTYVPAGDGTYVVGLDGKMVLTEDRKPVRINLRRVYEELK